MEHLVFSLSFWVSDCLVSDGLVLAAAFATSGPVGGNLFVWCTSCSGLGDSVPARLPAFCIVSLVMTRWWSLCHKQLQHSACDTRLLRSARRHERVTRRVGHRPLNPTGTPRRPLFFFFNPQNSITWPMSASRRIPADPLPHLPHPTDRCRWPWQSKRRQVFCWFFRPKVVCSPCKLSPEPSDVPKDCSRM